MTEILPLHQQFKNMQDVLSDNFNAPTNMYVAKYMFLAGREIDLKRVRVAEIVEANNALIYPSLKTAFIKGIEYAINDRAYKDSTVARQLRTLIEHIGLELNPV